MRVSNQESGTGTNEGDLSSADHGTPMGYGPDNKSPRGEKVRKKVSTPEWHGVSVDAG